MKTYIIHIAFIVILVMIGCTNHSMTPTNDMSTLNVSVSPHDGATGVETNASIVFTFATPVDRTIAERNIHLIGEYSMADSLCPVSTMMEHENMDMAMMDSMKMNHLMDEHSAQGRFEWDDASTRCTFRPDSMMLPNMRYMIHIGDEMMQMTGSRMHDMGMMGGHGNGMMSTDIMYHFRTADISSR